MNKIALSLTIVAAMCFGTMLCSPAQAQLRHTWVASNGSNGNDCDRLTPCATFDTALLKTVAGGEITCVDSGNFGGPFIHKSITINCESAIGMVAAPGGSSFSNIIITIAAGDVVILRGLDFDGANASTVTSGLINFGGAGTLIVDKVKMTNVRGASSGILFAPNGPAKLAVSNSLIAGNGADVATAGILIRPRSGGSANVTISRTELHGNVNGIFLNGGDGGGAVNLSVVDSVISGSSNCGIVVVSNDPALTAMIDRTTINSSVNVGVAVSGAAATVRIGHSTISGNVKGVAALNGGKLRSYKDNHINGNLTDGTPIAAVDALN